MIEDDRKHTARSNPSMASNAAVAAQGLPTASLIPEQPAS